MRHLYLLFFFTLAYVSACAQDKGTYAKDFTAGNEFLLKNNYGQALKSFKQAYASDSSNANINYKIGRCYIGLAGKKDEAVPYLEKAVKYILAKYNAASTTEVAAPRNAYYYLGIAYNAAYKFGEAINSFKTFRQFVTAKDSLAEIDHRIEQSQNARMFVMAPNSAKVINLGDSINSKYSDYNALVSPDESYLIFTSTRPISSVATDGSENNAAIFVSYRKNDSVWGMPKAYDKTLNSMLYTECTFISQDGQQLFVYSGNGQNSMLFSSFMGENQWNGPEALGGNVNNPPTATNACISPDGNTLYFVSDRPGGFGGKDIWRCVKLPNGQWSLAVNLGGTINTPYNEESPFMHADGKTFFFSSEGHMGIGGYDVFFTQLLENGKWVEPFNLGYPINTPGNETHFSLGSDSKHGYLNSDRPNGKGGQDIYEIIMPASGEKALTVIKGQIALDNGNALPDEVHILTTDNVTGQVVGDFKPVKTTGAFTIIVPPGKNYTLSYQNGSKEFYNEVIEVPEDAGYKEIRKALTLSPFTWKVTAIDSSNNGTNHQK
jgi:hypothetical protein